MPNDKSRPGQLVAMISSTSLDLPEHREQVKDACLRTGIFPIEMEQLPARDATGIQVSLEMVDQADIYIGIYAWRYGWVPDGSKVSITEMEFDRALERKERGELKEILIFLMHENHPLTSAKMVEADADAQAKLAKFKQRAADGRIRLEFKSAEELRGLAVQSLSECKQRIEAAEGAEPKPINFHPPNLIPAAPAPYIAHPYTLLQTSEVVGRRDELKLLTDWVTANKHVPAGIRLFNVVAIGGMGKSALTWKWFNDIAPNELPHLKGRMWWSFYESDAYFENFVIRALAYAAGMTEAAVRELPAHEREDRLFHLLDQQPFLLVLDGLERILLAYARMDAAHLADDDLDEQTANEIARFYGLPDEVKETYLEKHRLRQCADPRAGRFLRRLASVRASRVLVSTRLYPAELQTMTAQPLPGCYPLFLNGLTDDDALALWREFIGGERSGTSEQLLPLFNAFGNYPLLVRALAGRVASYRPAPGNYDGWRKDHPGFNPAAELDLRNAKTHVLHYALEGLGETQRQVLHTIAAFRMPATWDTLRAVLVGKGKKKPCRDDRALDDVLTELEDRGLVGWDRRANRYDLHPLVRGVVWQMLDVRARQNICGELHNYFQASPKLDDWEKVKSLEDLTPAVEMFHALVELERYDDAAHVFVNHLVEALIYRLGTSRQQIELLERLFPDGVEKLPRLASAQSQGGAIHVLAVAFFHNGEPRRAAQFYQRSVKIFDQLKNFQNLIVGLYSRSMALRVSGSLREAEIASSRALGIAQKIEVRFREEMCLQHVGIALATRGEALSSEAALRRSLGIFIAKRRQQSQGILNACLAQRLLWLNQPDEALPLAQEAWTLAHVQRTERDFINAARLHGEAALSMGDLPTAAERLYHAFIRARAVNFVEEELSALTALAELHRQQRKYDTACELLDQVWIPATRGPYPLLHADALNVLTTLERDAGNTDKAIAAATEAYKKAWCDGPPFAYHWGLEAARKHLRELGAPEPPMPPFDPSKFEPMPDVEINPKDEFYVEVDEAQPC